MRNFLPIFSESEENRNIKDDYFVFCVYFFIFFYSHSKSIVCIRWNEGHTYRICILWRVMSKMLEFDVFTVYTFSPDRSWWRWWLVDRSEPLQKSSQVWVGQIFQQSHSVWVWCTRAQVRHPEAIIHLKVQTGEENWLGVSFKCHTTIYAIYLFTDP